MKMNSIEIPVTDLREAVAWYELIFEFQTVWSDDFHALLGKASLGVKFLLVKTTDRARLAFENTNTGIKHSVIDFETDDLESFHRSLVTKGFPVAPLTEPANSWAPRGFSFSDRDGNCFGVYSYQPSR